MKPKFTLKKLLLLFALASCSSILLAQPSDHTISVNNPSNIAGDYEAYGANFGPIGCDLDDLVIDASTVVFSDNGAGVTTACDADGDVIVDASNKVLFIDRGVCTFTQKVLNGLATNPLAVVICSDERSPINPGGTDPGGISVPTFMISQADCALLRVEIDNGLNISIRKNNFINQNKPEAVEVLFYESFSNGLMNWTNVPISTNDPATEVETLSWDYTANDKIADACNISRLHIGETSCDGAAYFNFQSYNRKGCTVDGNTTLRFSAELISPAIDLSSLGSSASIELNFTQMHIPLNGQNAVSYSTDGGSTYSNPINVTSENVFTANSTSLVGNESVKIALPEVGNPSDFRLKFIAEGDFYYWLIDDIYLSELTGADATIVETFYTPLSYIFPSIHGDADPFLWQAQVRNNGGEDLVDGILSVELLSSGGDVLHTDQINVDLIEIGTVDTIDINENDLYVPAGLTPDTYTVAFDIDFPAQADNDPSDNTSSFEFQVSDNYWGKENTDSEDRSFSQYILSGTTEEDWGVAAVYIASPNLNQDQAHSIELSIGSTEDSMQDNFVTVYLLEYADGSSYAFNDDASFDRATINIDNHPDFNVLYRNLLVFDENFVPGSTITLDLVNRPNADPVNDPIIFEAGKGYVVAVQFDNSQGGVAPTSNYNLSLGSDPSIDGNGLYVFGTSDDGTNWYTGFTNGTNAPHLRLYRRMYSDSNIPQLAEHAFKVSPNPASNAINLEIELDELSTATLDIASMDGKIISSQLLENIQSELRSVDVSNLPNGTYMVRLATKKASKIHKVVVQH